MELVTDWDQRLLGTAYLDRSELGFYYESDHDTYSFVLFTRAGSEPLQYIITVPGFLHALLVFLVVQARLPGFGILHQCKDA